MPFTWHIPKFNFLRPRTASSARIPTFFQELDNGIGGKRRNKNTRKRGLRLKHELLQRQGGCIILVEVNERPRNAWTCMYEQTSLFRLP